MASVAGKALYFYESDSGEIHIVELDDKTLTLNISGTAQLQPAGPATSPFWAKVSRGATEYGLKPRFLNVCFTTTAPADLELGRTYPVVVLATSEFNAATVNGTVNYQGEDATVRGKIDENIYPGI
ncbi:MAG: hypothetical protein AAFZ35_23625 [Cyanobacteria bacterium J06649_12]